MPGSVADGGGRSTGGSGVEAGAGGGAEKAGPGSPDSGLGPPCERIAADRVIRRAPHPGQVMMLSGLVSVPITALQRGQFMASGPGRRV